MQTNVKLVTRTIVHSIALVVCSLTLVLILVLLLVSSTRYPPPGPAGCHTMNAVVVLIISASRMAVERAGGAGRVAA